MTLSAKPGCYVYKIGSNLVSKDGRRVTRNEEAALWFARERSSVPVPKVYAARYQQMGPPQGRVSADAVRRGHHAQEFVGWL